MMRSLTKKPSITILSNSLANKILEDAIEASSLRYSVNFKMIGEDFEEAIKIAKEYEDSSDVYMSGASITPYLQQRFRKPIVENRIDEAALFDAIVKLHASYPDETIGLLLYANPKVKLNNWIQISNLKIRQSSYNSLDDIRKKVLNFADDGIKAMVAPTLPCLFAKQLGIEAFPIYSQSSMKMDIEEAEYIACLYNSQQDHLALLQTIGDCSPNGIVGTDISGIIIYTNSPANDLLCGSTSSLKGRSILKLFPTLKLPNLSSNAGFQIVNIDNRVYLINGKPIIIDFAAKGFIFIIQEPKDITYADNNRQQEKAEVNFKAFYCFDDILGVSNVINNAKQKAKLFAKSDFPILIFGETGTGKELFAQSIHKASSRARGPFVSINCSALSETLIESELFGYEEGSFTGKKKGGKQGLIELANGGTLFLDEIADLSISGQAKLLRVIEEKSILKIGGRKLVPIDFRIIAATNADLEQAVSKGLFRSDLYYRINVLKLDIPPLRERREDIVLLFSHFLDQIDTISEEQRQIVINNTAAKIENLDWPGNVRQLKSFAQRIGVLMHRDFKDDNLLVDIVSQLDTMKPRIADPGEFFHKERANDLVSSGYIAHKRANNISSDDVKEALCAVGGSRTLAAQLLGVSRVTIWRKLKLADD